jgi:AraC family ethanolamine operon transcriptional activator
LVRLQVDTPVALEARPLGPRPDELFHIGAISFGGRRLLWQGLSVRPDMLMLEEGEVPSSFALPAGCELLVGRLGRERIESLVRLLRGAEHEPAKQRTQLHAPPASALAELRMLLRALVRADLPDDGALIASAEGDLYERVASMLAPPPVPSRPSPQSRRRALRRAQEYMHAHARERISLSDLCSASECSERTLRQAFRECYGTSPMAFIKKLRLQGLRQELRDAAPRSTTVLDRALRWGFWHMGHLARDYHSLFGETPSETLSRRFGATGAKLRTSRGDPGGEHASTNARSQLPTRTDAA